MSPPRTVWIVRGEVTDPSAYPPEANAKLGQTEWQFSDGPSGARGYSADYLDLAKGLAEHEDCVLLHIDADGLTVHGGSPACQHQWVEWDGVPEHGEDDVADVCVQCGGVKF